MSDFGQRRGRYELPIPEIDGCSESNVEQQLTKIAFFRTIESHLSTHHEYAWDAQLTYVDALAETGEHTRAAKHLNMAHNAVQTESLARNSHRKGNLRAPDVLRTQTTMLAKVAIAMYNTGLIDEAQTVARDAMIKLGDTLSAETPAEDYHVAWDMFPAAANNNAMLFVAQALAVAGDIGNSEATRRDSSYDLGNYNAHLAVLEAQKMYLQASGNIVGADEREHEKAWIIADVNAGLQKKFAEADTHRHGDALDLIIKLAQTAEEYGIPFDFSDTIERAIALPDDAYSYGISSEIYRLRTLARAHHANGADERSREVLSEALIALAGLPVAEAKELAYLYEEVAGDFALYGSSEIAEALVCNIGLRYRLEIREKQIHAALAAEDVLSARALLGTASKELYERFTETNPALDDFEFGVGLELAAACKKIGDYVLMDEIYAFLKVRNTSPYGDELFSADDGKNIEIARGYIEAGKPTEAFAAIAHADSRDELAFLYDAFKLVCKSDGQTIGGVMVDARELRACLEARLSGDEG